MRTIASITNLSGLETPKHASTATLHGYRPHIRYLLVTFLLAIRAAFSTVPTFRCLERCLAHRCPFHGYLLVLLGPGPAALRL